MRPQAITIAILLVLVPVFAVQAQLINLKTAPVATGDQFMIQPAANAGMGGVSVALNDTLSDPFINPAKGYRIHGTEAYMLPSFYHITNGMGGAKTLTVGALTSEDKWFGGLGVAIQQLNLSPKQSNVLKDQSANNNYVWAEIGKRISSSSALGFSFSWSGLGGMGGVNLLYPQSDGVSQHGHLLDFRFGLSGETDSRGNYEAVILFNQTNMTHEISYPVYYWGPCPTCAVPLQQTTVYIPQYQSSKNYDKTNTWGMHFGYKQPVGINNWTLGGIVTFNYKSHPHIPNYELMNIPRDPGNSRAFDIGIGTSHLSDNNVTFAADFILEPVWSATWANATSDITDVGGSPGFIPKGEKIVKNNFDFMNSILKTGLGWRGDHILLQAGIMAKTYRYTLKQKDYVQQTYRRQKEHWTEWTYSMSAGVNLKGLDIKYTAFITAGTGQPGTVQQGGIWLNGVNASFSNVAGSDFIFAPDGDLALNKATVFTNQITVTIPM